MSDEQETQETTAATVADIEEPTAAVPPSTESDDVPVAATVETADTSASDAASPPPEPEVDPEPKVERTAEATPEARLEPVPVAADATKDAEPVAAPSGGRPASTHPAPPPESDPTALDPRKRVPPVYRANQGPSQSRFRPRHVATDVPLEQIHYKNIEILSQFLDRQGRILSRRKTRVSAKKQRRLKTAIKQARHLALLPYTPSHIRGRR